ncbi:MAG TPA: DUF433 domain-containing protein [Chitinophagaceae bacterium]|nr:DUF433 domain-containing protein [Chitinophagaceae bacterium]
MIIPLSDKIHRPKLGEGIFLTSDVAEILQLPYSKVRRWIVELWDNRFANGQTYSFGEQGNKAINFYTLIEFYTFYQLRLKGISAQKIQKAHKIISRELHTAYPFATNIRTDGKEIWYGYLDELVNANGKQQLDIKAILDPFLHKIEFGKNNLAELYFPLEKSKNVVVDPKKQFGQPVINGSSLRINTIKKLHEGGETKKTICLLYDLKSPEVEDALRYYKRAS